MSALVDYLASQVHNSFTRFGKEHTCYVLCVISATLQFVGMQFFKLSQFDFGYALLIRGIAFCTLNLWIQGSSGTKNSYDIDPRSLRLLWLRAFFVTVQMFYLHYAVKRLPLYLSMVISNSSPIVIFILNYFLYQQKLTRKDILYIALCFLAITLTVCAEQINTLFFETLEGEDFSTTALQQEGQEATGSQKVIISFTLFLSLFVFATGILIVKSAKTEVQMVNLTVGCTFFVGGTLYYIESAPSSGSAMEGIDYCYPIIDSVIFYLFYGLTMAIGVHAQNYSTLQVSDTGRLFLPQYLIVVYSVIFNAVVYAIYPNLLEIIGIILCILCLYKLLVK